MTQTIKQSELKAGDVLLYHGGSFLSDLIRLFDGTTYSHAGVYDGTNVMEALGDGIEVRGVPTSVTDAKFVDVYRYTSIPAKDRLGDPGHPAKPVLDRVTYYETNRQRYAYEQILLLAMLASTRRIPVVSWVPGLNLIIRTVLDHAAELLSRLLAGGKEPVICSELVYRCYAEATGGIYALAISGADVLAPGLAADVASLAAAGGMGQVMALGGVSAPADPLAGAKAAFLTRYAAAKGADPVAMVSAMALGGGLSIAAVADFVTPGDLSKSPNLTKQGTLLAG